MYFFLDAHSQMEKIYQQLLILGILCWVLGIE